MKRKSVDVELNVETVTIKESRAVVTLCLGSRHILVFRYVVCVVDSRWWWRRRERERRRLSQWEKYVKTFTIWFRYFHYKSTAVFHKHFFLYHHNSNKKRNAHDEGVWLCRCLCKALSRPSMRWRRRDWCSKKSPRRQTVRNSIDPTILIFQVSPTRSTFFPLLI